ncbi:MAG: sensor histidine kinase [Chitinophagaceae bacterium]
MRLITKRRILLHVLCWVLLKGYELIFYTSGSSFDYAYRNAFSRFPAELILYYAGVAYILPAYFENRIVRKLVIQLLMTLAVATIAYRIGRYYFFPQQRIHNNFWQTLGHIPSFFVAPFYFISIPALGYTIFIFSKLHTNELQKKEAEKQRMIAEVNLLKSQIQPHFLFNTLNNLYGLALSSSNNTADSIMRLSKIMEYMLYNSEREFVPLGLEMQYIRDYIGLEKLRYGNRLQVSFDIDDSLNDKLIAPLLLFPFIENAFKHGSGKDEGDTWISVSLQKENSTIVYVVVNSISSTGRAGENIHPGGYGLQNLQKRLNLVYPGKYKLEQTSGEASYMSVLKLDL